MSHTIKPITEDTKRLQALLTKTRKQQEEKAAGK